MISNTIALSSDGSGMEAALQEAENIAMSAGLTGDQALQLRLIAEEMGEDVKLVNPAYETAMGLRELLAERGLEASPKTAPQKHEFYVSDAAERFLTFAKAVLSCDISSTDVVDIERY